MPGVGFSPSTCSLYMASIRAFSASSFCLASRARFFSSRAVLAMPRSSRSCCRSLLTSSARSTRLCSVLGKVTFLTPLLLVPLGECGGHVHLLDDVAPTDAGVIGTEGNLAFLGGVGDDALLG